MKKFLLLLLTLSLFACSSVNTPGNHCVKCDKQVRGQTDCSKCVPHEKACMSCEPGQKGAACSKSEKCTKPCDKKCSK